MREVSREWLEFLREQYPKGSRVRLTKMGNDPHPIPPGSMGTLKYIDDVGQFHVKWDNGRGLALIIGEDQFQILPPEPQTIKFYMPLTAQLYAYDDWGDLEEYGNDLDGRELRDYQSCIHEALLENQMPEEKNRGLMHWYDKPDGVNTKVQSVMLDVESRDGQLWGVAECKVNGTLLPEEKEALAEYISGQASDGWGEGFEQRAIKLNDGELYVSLWNSSNWSIQTEEERFSPDSLTCAGQFSPVKGRLFASSVARAATIPATGVQRIERRTAGWRTTTINGEALHRPRNKPCSPAVCAVGMCRGQTLSGMRSSRNKMEVK